MSEENAEGKAHPLAKYIMANLKTIVVALAVGYATYQGYTGQAAAENTAVTAEKATAEVEKKRAKGWTKGRTQINSLIDHVLALREDSIRLHDKIALLEKKIKSAPAPTPRSRPRLRLRSRARARPYMGAYTHADLPKLKPKKPTPKPKPKPKKLPELKKLPEKLQQLRVL